MKTTRPKLPLKASDYIQDYFREDFLFDVKEIKHVKGEIRFFVEVNKDEIFHLLQFDQQGNLVTSVAEEAFPPDIHEQPASGEVPD